MPDDPLSQDILGGMMGEGNGADRTRLVNRRLSGFITPAEDRFAAARTDPRLHVTAPSDPDPEAMQKMGRIQDLLSQVQSGASPADIGQYYGREWLARQGVPGDVASRLWTGKPLASIAQSYGRDWLQHRTSTRSCPGTRLSRRPCSLTGFRGGSGRGSMPRGNGESSPCRPIPGSRCTEGT